MACFSSCRGEKVVSFSKALFCLISLRSNHLHFVSVIVKRLHLIRFFFRKRCVCFLFDATSVAATF